MSLTTTEVARLERGGTLTEVILHVQFDSSYAGSGGEGPVDVPSSDEPWVDAWVQPVTGGYQIVPEWTAAGGFTGQLLVFYGDNNNASDGPLIAVPSGDLSAVYCRLHVLVAN